jgi:hypothetical protein
MLRVVDPLHQSAHYKPKDRTEMKEELGSPSPTLALDTNQTRAHLLIVKEPSGIRNSVQLTQETRDRLSLVNLRGIRLWDVDHQAGT